MAGGILPAVFPQVLMSVLRRRTALAWLAAAIVVVQPPAWADAGCGAAHIDEYAAVAYIYDGDTVRLGDGRHVRLVGINTPEIGHDGAPSQPYAVKAKQALMELISSHRHDAAGHKDDLDGASRAGLRTAFLVGPGFFVEFRRHDRIARDLLTFGIRL